MSQEINIIYHIVESEVWQAQMESEVYFPAAFLDEGFIHLSFKHQVARVLERYYAGMKNLLLLHIDAEKLGSDLIIEPSTAGESYPHLYAHLKKEAIVKIEKIESK
jgi:uncharacterized protein (DUF952 family)